MTPQSRRHSRGGRAGLPPAMPGVVVVGAGFGGLQAARRLQGAPVRLTVVDRHNYTLFQPLLYQVATAGLSATDVAVPIRSLLRASNTEVLLDEVVGIDVDRALVRLGGGREIPFNHLVLACGSQFNYFGHEGWADLAPGPKSLDDALAIRNRLLLAFEAAEMCADEAERRALMTFVIIGAGATGVEMAGAVAELAKAALARDFRRIDPSAARILLVEASPKVLGTFPGEHGAYAQAVLARLGVQLRLNAAIERIDADGVIAGGERIAARVVIWAAGMKATPVASWLGIEPTRHGTIRVNPDFSVPGRPNLFVIGDAAHAAGRDGKPLPALAAVAKQEGDYVGELIRRRLEGRPAMASFRYRDYGTMATIGRSAAVADLRGFKLKGRTAWVLWGVVHIYYLIGFRNRLRVLVNWFWAWLTYARGARLITGQERGRSAVATPSRARRAAEAD